MSVFGEDRWPWITCVAGEQVTFFHFIWLRMVCGIQYYLTVCWFQIRYLFLDTLTSNSPNRDFVGTVTILYDERFGIK